MSCLPSVQLCVIFSSNTVQEFNKYVTFSELPDDALKDCIIRVSLVTSDYEERRLLCASSSAIIDRIKKRSGVAPRLSDDVTELLRKELSMELQRSNKEYRWIMANEMLQGCPYSLCEK